MDLGGHCDIDINECVSRPCAHGAACTDSRSRTWSNRSIPYDAYSCACMEGFADGVCAYDFISEYRIECTVNSSVSGASMGRADLEGNCAIDVDECKSSPCQNGGTCTDSTGSGALSVHAHHCACAAGYNGTRCEIDVDECASSPCLNGATCTDSTNSSNVSVLSLIHI